MEAKAKAAATMMVSPRGAIIAWLASLLTVAQLQALVAPSPSPRRGNPSSLPAAADDADAGHRDAGRRAVVPSVKNLRPVVPGSNLHRAATLDDLTEEDAEALLDGSALADAGGARRPPALLVIDLRNADEVAKGKAARTAGARRFYASPDVEFLNVPVLGDVDAFWDEVISSMDPTERTLATLKTAFVGGALDRAAARHLERGGLPLLYSTMMTTGSRPLAAALDACLRASEADGDGGGAVVFHCQKGKDRTGVLAMLLETCLRDDGGGGDSAIVDSYALSGELLGELPGQGGGGGGSSPAAATTALDWSYFRGSPPEAMEETLAWTRDRYGSVEGYLDSIGFGEEKRARLRRCCAVPVI